MNIRFSPGVAPPEPRGWTHLLNRYLEPSPVRGVWEIAVTALPLVALWALAWFAFSRGYWWCSLLLAVPAAGFMVRMFIIQHDCGHGAFFPHKDANDWVGRAIGVLTMTPYDHWRRSHAIHHSTAGNLDRRGVGDIDTLTVREYYALSTFGRLKYKIYRNPIVLFGIGPAYMFLLQHRLPVGFMTIGWKPWISTQSTNAAIAFVATILIWLIGAPAFFVVHLPIIALAASAGVWLFYVQHQFDRTHWRQGDGWSLHEAALYGSSHYVLPWGLSWLTGNIGVHHVHHLCSRIPFYRLPKVLRDYPDLGEIGRVTLLESLGCARLHLWDEDRQRLVSFGEARLGGRRPRGE